MFTCALVPEPSSLAPHGVSEGGVLDHIPTGTHALVEHTLDKENTHLSWDIHQTRDNYSSLDMYNVVGTCLVVYLLDACI